MRDLSRLGFNTLKRNEGLDRQRPVYESGIFCFELCLYGRTAAYIKADGISHLPGKTRKRKAKQNPRRTGRIYISPMMWELTAFI